MLSLGKEALRHKSGVWICLITLALRYLTGWSNALLVALGVLTGLIWTEVGARGAA